MEIRRRAQKRVDGGMARRSCEGGVENGENVGGGI